MYSRRSQGHQLGDLWHSKLQVVFPRDDGGADRHAIEVKLAEGSFTDGPTGAEIWEFTSKSVKPKEKLYSLIFTPGITAVMELPHFKRKCQSWVDRRVGHDLLPIFFINMRESGASVCESSGAQI